MQHEDCNNWDYSKHPDIQTVVDSCTEILKELSADPLQHQPGLLDTRYLHRRMFFRTAPQACPCVAGNYRGSDFDCLRSYMVYFGTNFGTPPTSVSILMEDFHNELSVAVQQLDAIVEKSSLSKSKAGDLVKVVSVAAAMITRFFTIHPYANGNGHIGRLMVWILLARFNRTPVSWKLHKSPPGYGDLLNLYRAGQKKPLERFILQSVIA
ncbi:Fic family protein [Rhodoferax sp. GW822-FHT02A01]|uniref:Fic family protein n=1 Tax=Rhodoferax sp. GW822-FHT02A01 TaxID=3141537 RepID=UPI00315D883E